MTSKSSITTSRAAKSRKPVWNIHPGEILREEFLKPLEMTPCELAKRIHVPPPRVNDIILERRGVTADTAIRLARFFGTSVEFWMNAQSFYEVREAIKKARAQIERIAPRRVA